MTEYYQHVKTCAALDVAAARDYSVLSLVETHDLMRTDPFEDPRQVSREYRLVYQGRFQGDYGDQVDTVIQKLKNYDTAILSGPLHPAPARTLIIEVNGVGRTIYDLTKKKIPSSWHVVGALLTAGDAVTREGGVWHLNKREIINSLTHVIDEGTLKIPDDLPTKDTLLNEAAGFLRTFTPTGKEQLNSDTESRHDDTIISLAYCCWYSLSRQEARAVRFFG